MINKKIPIVIGVTGHRDLKEKNCLKLKELVESELNSLIKKYPNSEFMMLNSIAEGADTLCAEVALELGIKLVCPLPFEVNEYKKDFKGEALNKYEYLLEKASNSFVVPQVEPYVEGKDYFYRQAGIYVASNCHVLLALWDGEPGKEMGCGTAETVGFALEGNNKSFKSDDDGAVIWIKTPRKKNNKEIEITSRLIENKKGSLEKTLTKTDTFNLEATSLKGFKMYPLLGDEIINDSRLKTLDTIYNAADNLSLKRQKSYLKSLKAISIFSVLLVLCYLFYDEASLNICILGFGLILVLYAAFYLVINKANKHDRYLEYRALSESMRVQHYLSLLKIDERVYDFYTWTQKVEFTWIKKAVNALLIGNAFKEDIQEDIVKKYWIDEQLKYHINAKNKDDKKYKSMKHITDAMLIVTCIMYIAVLILEYYFATLMDIRLVTIDLRTLLKIAWGVVSAITLFASSYYGKMSLSRKIEDHDKMIILFKEAIDKYNKYPNERNAIFANLAKEEIIENGNWVSYSKENKPDFSL